MLKRIDRMLILSYLPPFFLAFLVALFVLIMQALWLFVDDIIGKGVGMFLIVELLGYMSISLFPLAFPIGILIASVMVFGNISERYELAAMKSSGMSLIRVMAPVMIVTFLISTFSFLCSNYFIPVANLKFKTRLYDIKRQKPTLSLQENVFNYDFAGITMRIGKKHEDGQTIEDVKIYDHQKDKSGKLNLVMADRGKMFLTEDRKGFVMQLKDGHQYSEVKPSGNSRYPFVKMDFSENEKVLDLTQFEINRTDEEVHKEHYSMLSVRQLDAAIDTLDIKIDRSFEKTVDFVLPKKNNAKSNPAPPSPKRKFKTKTGQQPDSDKLMNPEIPFVETFSKDDLNVILTKLKPHVSRNKPNITREKQHKFNQEILRAKHIYELHFKFASALICMIFLFIGAPMGAIIRKGGYGYPLLVTILFFMLYMILNISFKETMKVGGMDPFIAAWLPVVILIPIGVILTVKAMNDSKFLDIDRVNRFINRFRKEKDEIPKPDLTT